MAPDPVWRIANPTESPLMLSDCAVMLPLSCVLSSQARTSPTCPSPDTEWDVQAPN